MAGSGGRGALDLAPVDGYVESSGQDLYKFWPITEARLMGISGESRILSKGMPPKNFI